MMRMALALVLVTAVEGLSGAAPAWSQVLGVFRWQMQPYCNMVTFTVIQQASSFQLTGNDNLCGMSRMAPATGTATPNPDGTISFGFDIVTPSGATAHVSATVNLSNVSGTWRDVDGNTGAFVFNPPSAGGSPRPEPTRPVMITSAQLAASIFAGTGSASTIARSDHVHDDRYYTKPQADASVEAAVLGASEIIATPGVNVPALVNEYGFTFNTAESITSTTAGRWLISKTFRGYMTCPGSLPLFFLLVDGAPVVSSTIVMPSGTTRSVTLVGATGAAIAAGPHVVSIGADCSNANNSGSGLITLTAATVTVLR